MRTRIAFESTKSNFWKSHFEKKLDQLLAYLLFSAGLNTSIERFPHLFISINWWMGPFNTKDLCVLPGEFNLRTLLNKSNSTRPTVLSKVKSVIMVRDVEKGGWEETNQKVRPNVANTRKKSKINPSLQICISSTKKET